MAKKLKCKFNKCNNFDFELSINGDGVLIRCSKCKIGYITSNTLDFLKESLERK